MDRAAEINRPFLGAAPKGLLEAPPVQEEMPAWSVSVDSSIVQAHQHSATAPNVLFRQDRARLEEPTRLNDKNSPCRRDEPGDHGLGRCAAG